MTLFVVKISERKNQRAQNGKDTFLSSITLRNRNTEKYLFEQ